MGVLSVVRNSTPRDPGARCQVLGQFLVPARYDAPLEIVRIGVGSALLFHYAMATPFLFFFWGDDGWMPREVALSVLQEPWMQSVFYYFTAPWQWIAFHTLFLCAATAFVLGWHTSWVKWIVLIGHISYDYRCIQITYGAHAIAACLLFVMCLAPTGRAFSLDRVRAVRAAKRKDLNATLPPYRQFVGERVHAAHSIADGDAVLLQRHRQGSRRRLVGRRRRLDRFHAQ